jgi:hypothetical protein
MRKAKYISLSGFQAGTVGSADPNWSADLQIGSAAGFRAGIPAFLIPLPPSRRPEVIQFLGW